MAKTIAAVMFCIILCSCSTPAVVSKEAPEGSVETNMPLLIGEWRYQYASLANRFTERTYQCVSEMYSLSYHPVNSGPVCKEACVLLKNTKDFVDSAPAYIPDAKQYLLGDANFCRIKTKRSSGNNG